MLIELKASSPFEHNSVYKKFKTMQERKSEQEKEFI